MAKAKVEPKTIKHTIGQADIDANPGEGLVLGEEIEIDEEDIVEDPEAVKAAKKTPKAKVIKAFRDKDNFEIKFNIGDDVSHFDENRINDAIEKGLVKIG